MWRDLEQTRALYLHGAVYTTLRQQPIALVQCM
jgi:hypothetical protein